MSIRIKRKPMTSWKFFAVILAACFLMAAPQVMAQDSGQQEGYRGSQEYQYQQETNTDFSNTEIEKFAMAFNDVNEIRSEYTEVISEVKDAEKAQALQSQYTQKMIKSIEDKGLDVEQYNEISMAMQQDPEIREKVQKMSQ